MVSKTSWLWILLPSRVNLSHFSKSLYDVVVASYSSSGVLMYGRRCEVPAGCHLRRHGTARHRQQPAAPHSASKMARLRHVVALDHAHRFHISMTQPDVVVVSNSSSGAPTCKPRSSSTRRSVHSSDTPTHHPCDPSTTALHDDPSSPMESGDIEMEGPGTGCHRAISRFTSVGAYTDSNPT
jgi:hypothetical protein